MESVRWDFPYKVILLIFYKTQIVSTVSQFTISYDIMPIVTQLTQQNCDRVWQASNSNVEFAVPMLRRKRDPPRRPGQNRVQITMMWSQTGPQKVQSKSSLHEQNDESLFLEKPHFGTVAKTLCDKCEALLPFISRVY